MIPSTLEEAQALVQDFPGLDDYGTYNKAPEPMSRITAEDYSARLLHWQIVAVEHRQPRVLGYTALCIHWMNTGNGVGMSRAWRPSWVTTMGPEVGHWEPEYWLIGCPHGHKITCLVPGFLSVHTEKCMDCGFEFTFDSSG